jgi:hypothetical protein
MKQEPPKHRRSALNSLWLAAIFFTPIALNSCAHDSTRQFAPGAGQSRVAALKTFHVRNESPDKSELAADIAGELKSMGYQATTGTRKALGTDAVITFTDQWMWDITMYMLSLEIQLREPGSDAVFATAKTVRTSLVRKSQKEMVRETLAKLLKNP